MGDDVIRLGCSDIGDRDVCGFGEDDVEEVKRNKIHRYSRTSFVASVTRKESTDRVHNASANASPPNVHLQYNSSTRMDLHMSADIHSNMSIPHRLPGSDVFSSSPAFGTPLHPLPNGTRRPLPPPPAFKPQIATILPILLPPPTLRPLAFRTFTKKHNLTLNSSALQALATFIGRHCGSAWREEGTGEKVLEEVAKVWKAENGLHPEYVFVLIPLADTERAPKGLHIGHA